VHTEPSDMSFAVSLAGRTFEWSSGGLAALFGSRGNVTNPAFYSMLADMTRFNKEAPQYLERCKTAPDDPSSALSMDEYLRANGFGAPFRNWYLIPQIAAVWSASSADVLRFPARTFIQFCVNHSLLQVRDAGAASSHDSHERGWHLTRCCHPPLSAPLQVLDRPQWRTVSRRSREYIRKIAASLPPARTTIRLGARVAFVRRSSKAGGGTLVHVTEEGGRTQEFDHVVFGAHPDEVLSMLGEGASEAERQVLGRFHYQPNTSYLHTDDSLMPANKACWASWNYMGKGASGGASTSLDPRDAEPCCVTYWLNILQNLPPSMPQLFVTLNPAPDALPAPHKVLRTFSYAHPQYSLDTVAAQAAVDSRLQGVGNTWFAGAYLGYGFHEDAITAGLRAAFRLSGRRPAWWDRPLYALPPILRSPAGAPARTPLEDLLAKRACGGPYWQDNMGNGGAVGKATELTRATLREAAPASLLTAKLGSSGAGDVAGHVVYYPADVLAAFRELAGGGSDCPDEASSETASTMGEEARCCEATASSLGLRARTSAASPLGTAASDGTASPCASPMSVRRAGAGGEAAAAGAGGRALSSPPAAAFAAHAFKSSSVHSPLALAGGAATAAPTLAARMAAGTGGYTAQETPLQRADVYPSVWSYLWQSAKSAAMSAAASPVLGFLQRSIRRGCIMLRTPDGAERCFGDPSAIAPLRARLRVHSWSFFLRAAAEADLGLARSFMAGEWTTDDLTAVFHVFIANRESSALSASSLWTSWLGSTANYLSFALRMDNSIAGSRKNIHAHYDLSNDLFASFLDPATMMYSCAFFDARPRFVREVDVVRDGTVAGADRADASSCLASSLSGASLAVASPASTAAAPSSAAALRQELVFGGDLAEAQLRKLDHLIARANVQRGDRVLDLGFGWGGLSIRLAETVGCRVHGITLSREQFELASERVRSRGLQHLVTFEIVDYRDFAAAHPGEFDRIISVEMVEAVGHNYFATYMAALDSLLAPNGVVVLQAITLPEPRYREYVASSDFINTIIFPGGCCPSITALLEAAAPTKLVLQGTEDFALHYAETLRRWRANFNFALDGVVRPLGFDDTFIRTWNYYFCYCEAGFASQTLGLHVLTFARPGTTGLWAGSPSGKLAMAIGSPLNSLSHPTLVPLASL